EDKAVTLALERPPPGADVLRAGVQQGEVGTGPLVAPDDELAPARLDLPAPAMAPAEAEPHVAVSGGAAVDAGADARQRGGELEIDDGQGVGTAGDHVDRAALGALAGLAGGRALAVSLAMTSAALASASGAVLAAVAVAVAVAVAAVAAAAEHHDAGHAGGS